MPPAHLDTGYVLFISQSNHGLGSHRSSSWEITRNEGYRSEQSERAPQCDRIVRR
jgi:hypothetical protein